MYETVTVENEKIVFKPLTQNWMLGLEVESAFNEQAKFFDEVKDTITSYNNVKPSDV